MIKSAVHYRCAEEADIPQLAKLDKLAHHTYWSKEQYQSSFINQRQQIYLAEYAQDIVACIVFALGVDEVEVLQLWVVAEFRGHGIATHLLNYMVIEGRKKIPQARFILEVAENNQAAIQCYSRLGFVVIAHRKGYYHINGERVNALIMNLTQNNIEE